MACEYCEIIEGKKESAKLYEDNKVIAFLSEQPASIGHIVLAPKKHVPIFEAVSDDIVEHMFKIANKISVAVFESIKSEGTNIIVQNGIEAGQETPHFSVNIIPRRGDDGLLFEWTPKQLNEQDMATVELQLKEELEKPVVEAEIPAEKPEEKEEGGTEKEAKGEAGKGEKEEREEGKKETGEREAGKKEAEGEAGKEEKKGEAAEKEKIKQEMKGEGKEENYLIKQLRRMP